jgi:hypothetical protein
MKTLKLLLLVVICSLVHSFLEPFIYALYKAIIHVIENGGDLYIGKFFERSSMIYFYAILRFLFPLIPHLVVFSVLSNFIFESNKSIYYKIVGVYFFITVSVSLIFLEIEGKDLIEDSLRIYIVIFSAMFSLLILVIKPIKFD